VAKKRVISKKTNKKVSKKVNTTVASTPTPPMKHVIEYWDYNEVADYLEKLHGKDFRDYAGRHKQPFDPSIPYQDFWHWICDCNDQISNGGFLHLPEWDYYMNSDSTELWKKEILQYFYDFLGKDYHEKLRVSW